MCDTQQARVQCKKTKWLFLLRQASCVAIMRVFPWQSVHPQATLHRVHASASLHICLACALLCLTWLCRGALCGVYRVWFGVAGTALFLALVFGS